MTDLKHTVLHDKHRNLGAKLAGFGGWDMPINYTSIVQEHHQVREKCGLFDVSHMGELRICGPQAQGFLNHALTNDVAKLRPGSGQYSALLNHEGGILDDLILYRLHEFDYLLCVNAGNTEKDFHWLSGLVGDFDVTVSNESSNWAQLAIQGPLAGEILGEALGGYQGKALKTLGYMQITPITYAGVDAWVARTGYTGEFGYEIYIESGGATELWDDLFRVSGGRLSPVGLAARDTLRLEACYLLYGNDMTEDTSPIEAGIGWACKLDKGDFVGRNKLLAQKESGTYRQMYAFLMEDKAIARHGMEVFDLEGAPLGTVTSGSHLPTIGKAGGMMLLSRRDLPVGHPVHVDIRGKRKLARIAQKPLYSPKVK